MHSSLHFVTTQLKFIMEGPFIIPRADSLALPYFLVILASCEMYLYPRPQNSAVRRGYPSRSYSYLLSSFPEGRI